MNGIASNRDHVGELGELTWEPPEDCRFPVAEHPGADWLTILLRAAQEDEVRKVAEGRGLQLLVGEQGEGVFVIRP